MRHAMLGLGVWLALVQPVAAQQPSPSLVYGMTPTADAVPVAVDADGLVRLPPITFGAPQHVICDSGCSGGPSSGLTDAELRATPVPVSGTVTFANTTLAVTNVGVFAVQAAQSGAWTVAVNNFPASQEVTGTFWQATQPVSGSVSVSNFPASQAVTFSSAQPVSVTNFPGSQAVTGPITDAQLRATAVPVSGTIACSNCGGAVGTPFQCAMTSTATSSTVVTNCGAPGANLTRYITDITYASSIIATTTNYMTLQYGTGTNCGTGTAVVWRMFNNAAFVPVMAPGMTQPIKLGTNTDLCFLHPGAGTRVLNIQGYVAAP